MSLRNTLEPVVTAEDIRLKFRLADIRTAIKYMRSIPHLKAYQIFSGEWVCERQYYDEFIEELNRVHNMKCLVGMSMVTTASYTNWAKEELLNSGLTDEDIHRIIQFSKKG